MKNTKPYQADERGNGLQEIAARVQAKLKQHSPGATDEMSATTSAKRIEASLAKGRRSS